MASCRNVCLEVDLPFGIDVKARARIFASLLGMAFGNVDSEETEIEVAVQLVNLDGGTYGQMLADGLEIPAKGEVLLKPGGYLSFAEPNMLNPQVFAERNPADLPWGNRDAMEITIVEKKGN